MPNKNFEDFLPKKYSQLHKSKEAQHAARRHSKKEGESIEKPHDVLRAYLRDLEQIHQGKIDKKTGERIPPSPTKRERIKAVYHKDLVIKPGDVNDDYIKGVLLGNFAEQKGYDRDKLADKKIREYIRELFEKETGVSLEEYQIPQQQRQEVMDMAIQDQSASFDTWYDYLTSPEALNYPMEFKYWVFESLKNLGVYDKKEKKFSKRDSKTIAPYPELNQQALANVLDEVERKYEGKPSALWLSEEKRKELKELLKGENFGKLYAWAMDHVNSLQFPLERLPVTSGEWKTFSQGTDAKELTQTIQGFNTAWCIANEGTASSYLTHSDIYIYYSKDVEGNNTIPRSAIVTDGNTISEVRGIAQKGDAKQHLDDYIAPVVEKKLQELPGGEEWKSAMQDMQTLAEIHTKYLNNGELNKQDLTFLYELDHPIKSMGYQQDPRIKELRNQRNPEQDMPIVFECQPDQIATTPKEITKGTKIYVGKLERGIFNLIQQFNIEHVYTSFPESKIRFFELETEKKNKEELIQELQQKEINISNYAMDMMQNSDFPKITTAKHLDLVRLSVKDLGFLQAATTREIYERAEQLGLELCPPETGPYLCLNDISQLLGDWYLIAMKQIAGRHGHPHVLHLGRGGGGPWLRDYWAGPADGWGPGGGFVFSVSQVKT